MEESIRKPIITTPSISGAVCNFKSAFAGLPLKSHSVEVVATQSGSGTPSPSNPRPISGYSQITISHSGTNTGIPTVYIIDLNGTWYGGYYNANTGVFTVTWEGLDLGDLSFELVSNVESPYYRTQLSKPYKYLTSLANTMCNKYVAASIGATGSTEGYFITNANQLRVRDLAITDPSQLAGTILIYELASYESIQLPNCRLETLLGENNIWADTGNSVIQPFKVS